jgi:hypothetical protein
MIRRALLASILLFATTACTAEQLAWWDTNVVHADVDTMIEDRFGVEAPRAKRIFRCESNLRWDARNRKSGASGIAQIHPSWNKPDHHDPVAQFIGQWWEWRFVPAVNLEMAKRIRDAYGWGHWECTG